MKHVLVTGVSRGMGRATAQVLASEGYFVHGVFNTNKAEAERLKTEQGNMEIYQCDFSSRANTLELIAALRHIQFHGLVHSAGVFQAIDFEDFDMAVWDSTLNVNLHAPLLLTQGLKDNISAGGSIVTISSTDAMVGSISGMAYAASKAALINLTQSFANLFAAKQIRANNIAPGWIGDGMQAPEELLEEAKELNPLKRLGSYKQIADVVCFLLSEKSSYMNGATVVVDGGDMSSSYILQKEAEMLKQ